MKNPLACIILCLIIGPSLLFAGKNDGTSSPGASTPLLRPDSWRNLKTATGSSAASRQSIDPQSSSVASSGYAPSGRADTNPPSVTTSSYTDRLEFSYTQEQLEALQAAEKILEELETQYPWIAPDHILAILESEAALNKLREISKETIIDLVITSITASTSSFLPHQRENYRAALRCFASFKTTFSEIESLQPDFQLFVITRILDNEQITEKQIHQFLAARYLQDHYKGPRLSQSGIILIDTNFLPFIELLVSNIDSDLTTALEEIQAIAGFEDFEEIVSLSYIHHYLLRANNEEQKIEALDHIYHRIITRLADVILYLKWCRDQKETIDFHNPVFRNLLRLLTEFAFHFGALHNRIETYNELLEDESTTSEDLLAELSEMVRLVVVQPTIVGITPSTHPNLTLPYDVLLYLYRTYLASTEQTNDPTLLLRGTINDNVPALTTELTTTYHLQPSDALALRGLYTHYRLMTSEPVVGIQHMLCVLDLLFTRAADSIEERNGADNLYGVMDQLYNQLLEFAEYFPAIRDDSWLQCLENARNETTAFQVTTLFSIAYMIYSQTDILGINPHQQNIHSLEALKKTLQRLFDLFLTHAFAEYRVAVRSGNYHAVHCVTAQYTYLRERYDRLGAVMVQHLPTQTLQIEENGLLHPSDLFLRLMHVHHTFLNTQNKTPSIDLLLQYIFLYATQLRNALTGSHNSERLNPAIQVDDEYISSILNYFCIILNQFSEMFLRGNPLIDQNDFPNLTDISEITQKIYLLKKELQQLQSQAQTPDNLASIRNLQEQIHYLEFRKLMLRLLTKVNVTEITKEIVSLKQQLTELLALIESEQKKPYTQSRISSLQAQIRYLESEIDPTRNIIILNDLITFILGHITNFYCNQRFQLDSYQNLQIFTQSLQGYRVTLSAASNLRSMVNSLNTPLRGVLKILKEVLRSNSSPNSAFDTRQASFQALIAALEDLVELYPAIVTPLNILRTSTYQHTASTSNPAHTSQHTNLSVTLHLNEILRAISPTDENPELVALAVEMYGVNSRFALGIELSHQNLLQLFFTSVQTDVCRLRDRRTANYNLQQNLLHLFQYQGLLIEIGQFIPAIPGLANQFNAESTNLTTKLQLLYQILTSTLSINSALNIQTITSVDRLCLEILKLMSRMHSNGTYIAGTNTPPDELCLRMEPYPDSSEPSSSNTNFSIIRPTANPFTGSPARLLHFLTTMDHGALGHLGGSRL